jgi:hypothetical protein
MAVRTRRPAEEFATLVDEGTSAQELRYRELLAVVDALRATAVHVPRPECVANLRAALLDGADAVLQLVDQRPTPRAAVLRLVRLVLGADRLRRRFGHP